MYLSKEETESIEYFCSIIERIARETNNTRKDIIAKFSNEDIGHELRVAWCNSCLPNEQVIAEHIEEYQIKTGQYKYSEEYRQRFEWHQIGSIFAVYIVALRENTQDYPNTEEAVKSILSEPLSKLFEKFS